MEYQATKDDLKF